MWDLMLGTSAEPYKPELISKILQDNPTLTAQNSLNLTLSIVGHTGIYSEYTVGPL